MKISTTLLAVASLTSAKTIPISVGSGGLVFSPNSVTADVGDVLEFTFVPQNHSVVMGDFANACHPAATGGFFSGFIAGNSPLTFSVSVSSTDPFVFYCSQPAGSHCKAGMFGVVNPSGGMTLEAYAALAKASTSVSSPPMPFGSAGDSSSSSAASGPSSTPPSSSGSSPTTTAGSTSTPTGGSGGSSSSSSGSKPTATVAAGQAGTVVAGLGSVLLAAAFALFMA